MDRAALVAVVGGYLRGKKELLDERQRQAEWEKERDLQQQQITSQANYYQGMIEQGWAEVEQSRNTLNETIRHNKRQELVAETEADANAAYRKLMAMAEILGVTLEIDKLADVADQGDINFDLAILGLKRDSADRQIEHADRMAARGDVPRIQANILLGNAYNAQLESDLGVRSYAAKKSLDYEWGQKTDKVKAYRDTMKTVFDFSMEQETGERKEAHEEWWAGKKGQHALLLLQAERTGNMQPVEQFLVDLQNEANTNVALKNTPVRVLLARAASEAALIEGIPLPSGEGIQGVLGQHDFLARKVGSLGGDQRQLYFAQRDAVAKERGVPPESLPLEEKAAIMLGLIGAGDPEIGQVRAIAFPYEEQPGSVPPAPAAGEASNLFAPVAPLTSRPFSLFPPPMQQGVPAAPPSYPGLPSLPTNPYAQNLLNMSEGLEPSPISGEVSVPGLDEIIARQEELKKERGTRRNKRATEIGLLTAQLEGWPTGYPGR